MSFLAPLFLAGALAVALPILFHLIRRTSREKTVFSSLMFLQPTPPRVTRRSRLENIFLLLLRCLILCLLALGFARPLIQRPLAADSAGGGGKRVVILLDTSASMRRENLWAQAQARAQEIVRKSAPADAISLVTFDQGLRSLLTFEQWSAMSWSERVPFALKRLEETKPGWGGTHLGNALLHAVELLEEASSRDQDKQRTQQVVVCTDLQEGSRLEGLQGYEWPRGIEVSLEPLLVKRPTNAGLQLVTERDDADQTPLDASPRVRVQNAGNSKREQFQIGWLAGEGTGLVGAPFDAYVPPGQSRTIQAPKPPAGLPSERLGLTGDDQDFDNVVYLVPPKAEQIKILYLGNEKETDSTQPLYFVQRAFPQTRRQNIQIVARSADSLLLPSETDGVQLMMLADAPSEDRLKGVQRFLSDGKTVLLVMKSAGAARALSGILGQPNLTAEEAVSGSYAMLGRIDFEHPLFAPFADPRFSDFTKIHFWKHRRLDLGAASGARVVARFDGGDPALVQFPVGKGTLLVLTSAWHPADSQLALSTKFVPLLYSILEQSGGVKAQLAQYVVGDPVALTPPETNQTVVVRKPDGTEIKLASEKTFAQTDAPGVYAVTSMKPPMRFAVNLAPEESRTAPLALDELERLGLPLKPKPAELAKRAEEKVRLQVAELENRQKLWRWLIVAALVVLMLESWLAGRLTRRGSVPAGA